MKKLLFLILGISFCFLLAFISAEFFLRAIPNDFNKKIYYFKKFKDDSEVLILGSSHSFVGIDPKYLKKKAFNFAYSSQTLDLDEKLFNQYKSQLPKLQTIIIPVSYFSYVLALEDGTSAHKIKNYNIYYSIYSHTFQLKNQFEVLHQDFKTNFTDFQECIINPYQKITINNNGFINKRYIKRNLDWEESALHAVHNHTKDFTNETTQKRIDQNIKSLENMISWADKNKVKVILVSTPTTNLYLQNLEQIQYNHWRETTTNIAGKFPNVIWLNYLDNNDLFSPTDFQNADHLNAKGAIKLSKLINQYL